MAFASIVVNYWCQAVSPPANSGELALVVDFDPSHWIDSVRFDIEGNVQNIEIAEAISVAGNSASSENSRSTHKCE